MKRMASLVATIATFGFAWIRAAAPPPSDFDVEPARTAPVEESVCFEVRSVSSGVTRAVHSATAVELADGTIRAFWYGGTREGAKDVAIYTSVFGALRESWSQEVVAVTRGGTQRELGRYIKKLGNPVASRDSGGRLWLFYVSVSVGGWSGSAVNLRISEDGGDSWGPTRRLITSPFLNLSTLVRGPMFHYEDGTFGLPVYHELLGKFGELVRLDENGHVLDKTRLSSGYSSLQPVIVPLENEHALGLMRRSGSRPPRMLAVETRDAGRSWSDPAPTVLANPDAAIAALRMSSGEILVAFNDSEVDRSTLSLALSEDDGDSWEIVHVFEPLEADSDSPARFAYPWLLESSSCDLHLLYTWNRTRIVHVRFNRAWLLRNRQRS